MARADHVPLLAGGPLLNVRATLHGRVDIRMAVDTGAQHIVISRQAAVLLGFDLVHQRRLLTLVGVGQSPPVPLIRLDRVQVGSHSVDGLAAAVYDLPPFFRADGLLGLSFLRRFRVTFDFDAGVLILRDPAPRRPPAATPPA